MIAKMELPNLVLTQSDWLTQKKSPRPIEERFRVILMRLMLNT